MSLETFLRTKSTQSMQRGLQRYMAPSSPSQRTSATLGHGTSNLLTSRSETESGFWFRLGTLFFPKKSNEELRQEHYKKVLFYIKERDVSSLRAGLELRLSQITEKEVFLLLTTLQSQLLASEGFHEALQKMQIEKNLLPEAFKFFKEFAPILFKKLSKKRKLEFFNYYYRDHYIKCSSKVYEKDFLMTILFPVLTLEERGLFLRRLLVYFEGPELHLEQNGNWHKLMYCATVCLFKGLSKREGIGLFHMFWFGNWNWDRRDHTIRVIGSRLLVLPPKERWFIADKFFKGFLEPSSNGMDLETDRAKQISQETRKFIKELKSRKFGLEGYLATKDERSLKKILKQEDWSVLVRVCSSRLRGISLGNEISGFTYQEIVDDLLRLPNETIKQLLNKALPLPEDRILFLTQCPETDLTPLLFKSLPKKKKGDVLLEFWKENKNEMVKWLLMSVGQAERQWLQRYMEIPLEKDTNLPGFLNQMKKEELYS